MTDTPKVTQADRDAAADYLCSIGQHGSAQQCRDGKGWRTTAEAFAAHREQSTAALQAEDARLRERETELVTTLRIAERHLRHMAARIQRRKAGYNFESLGEDMPAIEAALASKENQDD